MPLFKNCGSCGVKGQTDSPKMSWEGHLGEEQDDIGTGLGMWGCKGEMQWRWKSGFLL